jgi:signal transduction histidine kinase
MSGSRPIVFYLSLSLGIFTVLTSLYGFHLLRSRPGLPEGIDDSEIVQIDQYRIDKPKSDLELVLAQKRIGEWVTVQLRHGVSSETRKTQIIPFYSQVPFPTIYLLIGLFSYLIGFLALAFRWEDARARILYLLALAFSLPLIVSGGTYGLRGSWTTYVPMILFNMFYPLAPALLVHFSFSFSKTRRHSVLALIYGVSLLFGCGLTALVLLSVHRASTQIFRLYSATFTVFRAYMVGLLLLAIASLIRAYREERLQENRAQIKWIFLGLLLGLSPFIFLYQIPRVLGIRPLLTEEFSTVFFAFIPLGLALAIFRFRFLNVDIVINRSLVYSLLTFVIVGVYLFSVRIFQDLPVKLFAVKGAEISLGSALLAAVVFEPARRRIQELVDRSFFRQSYDYKKAILKFSGMAKDMPSQSSLIDFLKTSVQTVLPVDRLEVMAGTLTTGECQLFYPERARAKDRIGLMPQMTLGRVCAHREAVSTEEGVDFSQGQALLGSQWEIALPLPFRSAGLVGCLLAGKKRSGHTFTRDDIDLLLTLTMALSLNLEKIRRQEEIIYERAAREKLDELNRLKTEFVSTVSHELRTPLTSIQGLTEILEAGKVQDAGTRDEILHTLASESGRLSRLLHNILEFGKIEQQTKAYTVRAEDIGLIIKDLVAVFRPQFEEAGFAVDLNVPHEPVLLEVDRDAIEQLLINLIDNAMKYSTRKKQLGLDLLERPGEVEIRVRDRGIGISLEDRERIFDKFYRGSGAARINPKGVGLGLKIARHIVEAHGGEILVECQAPAGTTFRIVFPRSKTA